MSWGQCRTVSDRCQWQSRDRPGVDIDNPLGAQTTVEWVPFILKAVLGTCLFTLLFWYAQSSRVRGGSSVHGLSRYMLFQESQLSLVVLRTAGVTYQGFIGDQTVQANFTVWHDFENVTRDACGVFVPM